jgi:hypothetical protein
MGAHKAFDFAAVEAQGPTEHHDAPPILGGVYD